MKLSVQHLRRAFERAEFDKNDQDKNSRDHDGRGDGDDDEEDGRFAPLFERITATLIEQIDGLSRIANDFSRFARMPTRVSEPLDLSETVEAAASLMREEEPDADILLDLHPDPLVIEADAEELRRLYINLIKNALQALPEAGAEGQREGRVEIATERAPGGRARSTVTDDGSGIPEELREKIFQPNFSTKTSGTGLGLAIAEKSVEELGGEIGFETETDVGTMFWIELPLAEQEEEEDAEAEEAAAANAP
jgi:signal transduction histidine kinase